MTLPATILPSAARRQQAATVALPSFRDILIRRRIEAPRRLVWEVLTRPEHLARWLGAPCDAVMRADVDLRTAGGFHFAWRRGGGGITTLRGTYHDIVVGRRLVFTATERCAHTLHALSLDDVGGATRLALRRLSPATSPSADADRLSRLERYLRALA